jgi:two-component system phosphate regulon response regulator PhoB
MYPAPRTVTRIGICGCSTVADALRNIVFRFDGSRAFASALAEGDQELALPSGETVADGEWVLAMFEVGVRGARHRATASAARGLVRGPGEPPALAFERRDWERLVDFAEAGSVRMLEAAKVLSEPLRPAARPVAPSPAASVPYARILVVDDEREVCEIVGAMLEAVGLAVDAVGSAEDALERIRGAGERVDLVVLDWNLPGMNGIELCRVLRKDPAHAMLPVLVLSGRSSTQDVVDAFASGADDYVGKPFRAPELGARIFSLLRRARMVPANPA